MEETPAFQSCACFTGQGRAGGEWLPAAGCGTASVHGLARQLLQEVQFPGSLLSEVRTQLPDFDCTSSIPCCQELSLLCVEF